MFNAYFQCGSLELGQIGEMYSVYIPVTNYQILVHVQEFLQLLDGVYANISTKRLSIDCEWSFISRNCINSLSVLTVIENYNFSICPKLHTLIEFQKHFLT